MRVWLSRAASVAAKELREYSRSALQLILSVLSPAVVFLLFAYGFSLDVRNMPFSYLDLSDTPESRRLMDTFTSSRYFEPVARRTSLEQIADDLHSDAVRFALVVPSDYSRRLLRGRSAQIQLLVNGTMASRAIVVRGYAEGAIADYNMRRLSEQLRRSGGGALNELPLDLLPTAWFNPSLESKNVLVPGLAGVVLLYFVSVLAAVGLSREKESGMILNMYTSPLTRSQFLAGKALPYLLIGLGNFLLFFALARTLFGVPFNGDFIALLAVTVLFVLGAVGIGLLVATLVRSQVAALLITSVATFLPGILYSGLLMPIESMGVDAQMTAAIFPMAYYVSLTKKIHLKGVGWPELVGDALGLALFAVLILAATLAAMRKRIG